MVETKGDRDSGQPGVNIEEILRERERLERIIQEQFKKEVAILFTDICGYTQYMDTRGDISGRALLQRHNDIVFDLVTGNNGRVVKSIGDAVMAIFTSPLDAVKAAVAIQKSLQDHNQGRESVEEIHVKIGVNFGSALMEDQDIFGDVVNVASRIQSKAGKDQILISEDVYNQVRGSEDILCRYHDRVSLKGKPEPLPLYRVIWRDESAEGGFEPSIRADEHRPGLPAKAVPEPIKVLYLEASREGEGVRIGAHERAVNEESTLRHYEDLKTSMAKLTLRCQGIVELLNSANRKGQIPKEVLVKLRETGQVFYDELLSADVKSKLRETRAHYLIVNLDDQLVQIPWELLHDGREFLCQRFNMGRLVRTRQKTSGTTYRKLERPLKMLVLADPRGNLKWAYQEGKKVRDSLDERGGDIDVSLRTSDVSVDFIRGKIRNFDIIHFAGHAEYDPQKPDEGGWLLTDEIFRARDIMKMWGTTTMPALIFSNACQSARTEEWALKEGFEGHIFGLANAFLLTGAKHYVGTFWEILDEPSSRFALEFYKFLFQDATIGEAIRLAREELIRLYGEETIVWASYVLYGDPTFNYMDHVREIGVAPEPPREAVSPDSRVETRAREEKIPFEAKRPPRVSRTLWGIAAIVVLAAFLVWGYFGYFRVNSTKQKQAALNAYISGDYARATEVCREIQEAKPRLRFANLLLGNISFMAGNLEVAEKQFRKALDATEGSDEEMAEALMGLGRIASINKKTNEALGYYQKASALVPGKGQGQLSQAILLSSQGAYEKALPLFRKATELSPEDRGIRIMTRQTEERVSVDLEKKKQEKIDRLVQELLKSFKEGSGSAPADRWTAQPLTVWLMDFVPRGYSLQEGREQLLASGIMDHLIEKSRARFVERTLLDKLLEELKLSTSRLADRSTALSLGKIVAARLILSGQVITSGPETQVTLHLIETETGEVRAAVSETFGTSVPPRIMAEKLSGVLMKKLKSLYPLRGEVSEMKGETIVLNVGQNAGVRVGQEFRVKDTDSVVEIVGIGPDTSTAKLKAGKGGLQPGLRVEAL